MGLGPGEWDPGWHVLKALEKLRLVRNIGLPRASHLRHDLVEAPPVAGLTEASLAGPSR
jgi:sn-1 stearoyl-lipid 9-desaturase